MNSYKKMLKIILIIIILLTNNLFPVSKFGKIKCTNMWPVSNMCKFKKRLLTFGTNTLFAFLTYFVLRLKFFSCQCGEFLYSNTHSSQGNDLLNFGELPPQLCSGFLFHILKFQLKASFSFYNFD